MQESAIQEGEQNSEGGSLAEADTQLATAASSPSFFGPGLNAALAGGSAYAGANLMESLYSDQSPSGFRFDTTETRVGPQMAPFLQFGKRV